MTTTSDQNGLTAAGPDLPVADPLLPPPAGSPVVLPPDDEHPTVTLPRYAEPPARPDDVLPVGPVGPVGGRRRVREEREAAEPQRRTGPTPLGRVILPAALALVSGVALVFGWMTLQNDRSEDAASQSPAPAAAAVAPASSPSAAAAASPKASAPAPAASTSTSAAPAPSASAAAAPAASSSAAPAPSTSTAAPSVVVDRSVPVVVLNSTARTGLAAKVAAALRKDGWKVVSIGNYRPTLAATTIYAEGHARAVSTLKGDLPTSEQVAAPVGRMSPARLTVVVGPDYPRG